MNAMHLMVNNLTRSSLMMGMCILVTVLTSGTLGAEEARYFVMMPDGAVTSQTVTEIIAGLTDSDPHMRLTAALLLRHVEPRESQQIIPPLIQLLDDFVETVRNQAVETLYYVGPDTVSALIDVVKGQGITSGRHDTSVRLQRLAVEALGSLAWRSDDAKKALLEIVQDPNIHTVVRYSAFGGLSRLGTGAPGVAPILIGLVQRTNEDLSLRQAAIMTLEALGPQPETIEALGQLLRDGDVHIRQEAASALARLGPPAKKALPQLQAALNDGDAEVRVRAAIALKNIGKENR